MSTPQIVSLTADQVLMHSPNVAWQRLDDQIIVLDLVGRTMVGLNLTGGRVWELCDGARRLGDIAELLAREYDRPQEDVMRDVMAFAEMLVRRECLCPANQAL